MGMDRLARAAALAAATLLFAGCQSSATFKGVPLSPQDTGAVQVQASLAKPEGKGPFPAVVLLHSCGGILPHLDDWSRFLVERGYAALTVDSFGSRRFGPCPNGRHSSTWAQIDMVSDAYGALEHLAARPDIAADRIYVMGFSLGGWAIRAMATSEPPVKRTFRAGVALYSGCQEYRSRERLTFPTLVVTGTNDGIDFASCEAAAQERRNRDLEVRILEGAYHAFDVAAHRSIRRDVGGRPMLYSEPAVREAKALVEGYLARR
jgi:dienelactone hydrolase